MESEMKFYKKIAFSLSIMDHFDADAGFSSIPGLLAGTQKLNRHLIFWPRIPQLPLVAAIQLLCPRQ
ncbi:MAG: hypothetical protein FWC50_05630 [Planctomycetaceae bacterium]|nr:hypothetical protein [Planctomycetaceae bacterium]